MKQAPKNLKIETKVRPEVAKIIKKLSKKYTEIWQNLAKV